jgi:hypothetical protein
LLDEIAALEDEVDIVLDGSWGARWRKKRVRAFAASLLGVVDEFCSFRNCCATLRSDGAFIAFREHSAPAIEATLQFLNREPVLTERSPLKSFALSGSAFDDAPARVIDEF